MPTHKKTVSTRLDRPWITAPMRTHLDGAEIPNELYGANLGQGPRRVLSIAFDLPTQDRL